MQESENQAVVTISDLMKRAREAQQIAQSFSQEKVDELAAAVTWEIVADDTIVRDLAEYSYQECRLGDVESKFIKVREKCRGVYFDVKHEKTVGIVQEIPEKGLRRITKPVGVIGSLVPSTQAEMHPLIQAIFALKARDAVIFAPHPRGKRTTAKTVELIRNVMRKYDAPEDLFIAIEEPSIPLTNELMKQCDLVMATGGQGMVQAAYSSGTPAFGVGAGNAIIIVDESADLPYAARSIQASKTFDLAAGCSCDNSLVIDNSVYDEMLAELASCGAYLCSAEEKEKLQQTIWPQWPKNHNLNRDIVAAPVEQIAQLAGITIPEGTTFLLVEESQTGSVTTFSGEKMSLVTAIYRSDSIDEAITIINENHAYSGAGHSCGIYSHNQDHIEQVALRTFTTRVVVNLPQAATNTGNWNSGMPFTSSLGCGTWGGNSASENIALKHYLNNTWMISEIPYRKPTDEELFAGFTPRS